MARYMRSYGKSYLKAPVVVGAGIAWHGPGTYLTSPDSPNQRNRRAVHSRLEPPAVVAAPQGPFFGPKVYLSVMLPEKARRTVTSRSPQYQLKPPVILQSNLPSAVTLAPQSRRRGVARLEPPAVVTAAVTDVFYGPSSALAPQSRRRGVADLKPPVEAAEVVDVFGGIMLVFAQPPRRKTQYLLRNYIVAAAAAQAFYGPAVNLTYSRRGQAKSSLRPPAILASNLPTQITLAPQRRGLAKSEFKPPTVVFLAVEIYGPEVHLTRIKHPPVLSVLQPPTVVRTEEAFYGPDIHLTLGRRPVAKTVLHPPTVVFLAVELSGPKITLARIKPPPTLSFLRAPTDVSDAQDIGILDTHLTYSRRGVPKSRLIPPAVVAPVVSYGPYQWLTYSRRGEPTRFLKPPTVVASPPAYQQVLPPWLTYSRRGRPTYFLNPPTIVFPFFARATAVSLAPQSRGRPTYFLTPPVVVRLAVEIYGPEQWLTYSRRGRPLYRLEPPTVLGRAPFRGLLTHLTYSRRGRPIYFQLPAKVGEVPGPPIQVTLTRIRPQRTWLHRTPAVVRRQFIARAIQVHLTQIRPRPTVSLIKPPTVVDVLQAGVLQIHLTRIKPQPTISLIKPPTVVGAGIAFYGPQTWLVRIKHPPVYYNLPLVLVAFRRHGGDVCGFDIAGSFVCSLELPGSQVSGGTSPTSQVTGSSRAASSMTGSDSPRGSVSGSDRKAT